MKVWPLSKIAGSPMLDRAYAYELEGVYLTRQISHTTFRACKLVAANLLPMETPLVIIESEDANMAYAYIERPEGEDFARLERGNFVQNKSGFVGFMVDRLH